MPKPVRARTLIRRGRIVENDQWISLADDTPLPPLGDVLVSPQRLAQEAGLLLAHDGALGVIFAPDDEPGAIAAFLPRVTLAAIKFPGFRDGRGFSLAQILRCRFGYKGEVRATGDVLRDQLFFMMQCGFDAFELADNDPMEAYKSAQNQYSRLYGADTTASIWRARAAASPPQSDA
jgi:uncharacterized protein (DUF934 family)